MLHVVLHVMCCVVWCMMHGMMYVAYCVMCCILHGMIYVAWCMVCFMLHGAWYTICCILCGYVAGMARVGLLVSARPSVMAYVVMACLGWYRLVRLHLGIVDNVDHHQVWLAGLWAGHGPQVDYSNHQ